MLLADMGADVIKVEKIPGGDDTRRFTPPEVNGEASAFLMMNRNKRGIALDLRQPAAKVALQRITTKVDVIIEKLSYRHDGQARPWIRRAATIQSGTHLLRGVRLWLVGTRRDKGGFDLVAQGLSGLMRITGEPGGAPTKVGSPVRRRCTYALHDPQRPQGFRRECRSPVIQLWSGRTAGLPGDAHQSGQALRNKIEAALVGVGSDKP